MDVHGHSGGEPRITIVISKQLCPVGIVIGANRKMGTIYDALEFVVHHFAADRFAADVCGCWRWYCFVVESKTGSELLDCKDLDFVWATPPIVLIFAESPLDVVVIKGAHYSKFLGFEVGKCRRDIPREEFVREVRHCCGIQLGRTFLDGSVQWNPTTANRRWFHQTGL